MFRSFFPVPKIFFSSAVVWMLLTTLLYQFAGDPVRSVISIDRFLAPAICAPADVPADQTTVADDAVPDPAPGAAVTDPNAPATTESAAPATRAPSPTASPRTPTSSTAGASGNTGTSCSAP